MLEFREESFRDCFVEMAPLLRDHWEEVAIYKDKVVLDVDVERYMLLEDTGVLHIVTARDEGELVGYFVSFINPHLHYRQTTYALNDVLFLHPDYRHKGNAEGLFSYAENALKARGVDVIVLHMKTDHPFHRLSEYLGYDKVEFNYSKYIGDK